MGESITESILVGYDPIRFLIFVNIKQSPLNSNLRKDLRKRRKSAQNGENQSKFAKIAKIVEIAKIWLKTKDLDENIEILLVILT